MEQYINGKVQKINDEDYEIIKVIETDDPYGAREWYMQNYGCDIEEARTALREIRKRYKIDYGRKNYIPAVGDIIEKMEELREEGELKESEIRKSVLQWYMSKSGATRNKAIDKMKKAGVKFGFFENLWMVLILVEIMI